MGYVSDREYTPSERAIIAAEYIICNGSITRGEVMKLVGLCERAAKKSS